MGRNFLRPATPTTPLKTSFKYAVAGRCPFLHRLFFLGYLAHNPTKTKAPAYTFRGAKPPVTDSCSPGPRYYVPPSITRNGKYVAPAQHICGLPKIKTEITPGPSEYHFSSPSFRQHKHALLLPCATGVQNHQLTP